LRRFYDGNNPTDTILVSSVQIHIVEQYLGNTRNHFLKGKSEAFNIFDNITLFLILHVFLYLSEAESLPTVASKV
jgi:hypothetical protein